MGAEWGGERALTPSEALRVLPDVKAHRFLGFSFRSYVMAKSREYVISGHTGVRGQHRDEMDRKEGAMCTCSALGQLVPLTALQQGDGVDEVRGRG